MRHLARMKRGNQFGDINGFLNNFFDAPIFKGYNACDCNPSVDIRETKDDLFLTFELPGMEKDKIKVGIKETVLTVSGERKARREEDHDDFVRSEIWQGSFSRSFTLPKRIDLKNISADYKNGLLEIKLGKLEESKPKEIEVSVS